MGIRARSQLQKRFENNLRKTNPNKIRLIRAKPFTCDQNTPGSQCFKPGRRSINEACPICEGTGYLGGHLGDDDTGSLYSWTYRIHGDVQTGHGLYGAGGDYIKLIADLGKMQVGDATLFCFMEEYDRQTNAYVYPKVDKSFPRPDRIISNAGITYQVIRGLIAEKGSEKICRIITLDEGLFSPQGAR